MKKKYLKPDILVHEMQHIQPIMQTSGNSGNNDPVQDIPGEGYGGEGGGTEGSAPA